MQQEEPPTSTILEYARTSRSWRFPPVHWPTTLVTALAVAALNWFHQPRVPYVGMDELIDIRGWPWTFQWIGGMGGTYVYDLAALGLDVTFLLLVALGAGIAVRRIPWQGHRPSVDKGRT